MPLNNGDVFAGYTIVRRLGPAAWARSIWRSIHGGPAATP
jgi:hypothetical protein